MKESAARAIAEAYRILDFVSEVRFRRDMQLMHSMARNQCDRDLAALGTTPKITFGEQTFSPQEWFFESILEHMESKAKSMLIGTGVEIEKGK